MHKVHLTQPGFIWSDFEPFTKNKERTQNLKETVGLRYIYQNKLDIARFQHDIAMEILKIYLREWLLIKCYVTNHLILLKTQNMMNINVNLFQWFINFLFRTLLVLILQVVLLRVQINLLSKVKLC